MGKWWENFDWRFIQTNLRELDMKDIDAAQYVADLKSFHATVAMINTSGIIASYPTKLPYHYQSPFLTGDSLKTIIEACHQEGIKVMARTDFSKIRRSVYEAHPDWAYVDVNGQIVDYGGDVHVCLNSDYQQTRALHIIRETLEELDVDGIFFNMGGYVTTDYSGTYHGICHCQRCQKRFRDMYHLPLPKKADPQDDAWRKYVLFKGRTSREYSEKVCRFIKSLRPDILINHDLFTETSGFIRQESNTALDRALPHWQYSGSENTKWVRGSYPGHISSNTSVDFIDFPVRHVAVSPYQQELRLYQNLANAGSLDYYLIGRLDTHADRSGYDGIRRVFRFHQENERYYRNNHADCETVILTGEHWGGHGAGDMSEFFGLYRVLTETHQLFDVMVLPRVKELGLAKYKTVILPNMEWLDDDTAKILDDFVASGNTLLATGNTSFLDCQGTTRSSPALDCLGITATGVNRNARGAYFTVDDKDVFSRFQDSDLIFIDGDYAYVEYDPGVSQYLKLLPPQPFGPPEHCYPLFGHVDHPAVAVNPYGKGCAIHIPWLPGRLFHRQGYSNTFWYLADVFENLLRLQPVKGNLPPTVETTLVKSGDTPFRIFHLINNNGHYGNSFFAPTPIHGIACEIPLTQAPASVRSLVSGTTPRYQWKDGCLFVALDKLNQFEALLIED